MTASPTLVDPVTTGARVFTEGGSEPRDRRRETFVMALGAALHRAGAPAHRLERILTGISRHLGLEGQFFSTPTALTAAFGPPGAQHSGLVRVAPGEIHLERLFLLDRLADTVVAGDLDLHEAERQVAAIEQAPPRFGPARTVTATAGVSTAAAGLFGDALWELVLAGIIGGVVGLLSLVAARVSPVKRLHLPLAAAVATVLAELATSPWPAIPPHRVALYALIVMVPGLPLTVAANELATGHLVSGTARLAKALVVLLQMGLGVVLGSWLATWNPLEGSPPLPTPPLPAGTLFAAGVLAALSLVVLFRAHPRHTVVILGAVATALLSSKLAEVHLTGPGPAFLGALSVGCFGNLYARLSHRPSLVAVVPGILLLVPGSVGFEAISAMLAHDPLTGIETAFRALLSAMALAAGLLLATALLPPRRSL